MFIKCLFFFFFVPHSIIFSANSEHTQMYTNVLATRLQCNSFFFFFPFILYLFDHAIETTQFLIMKNDVSLCLPHFIVLEDLILFEYIIYLKCLIYCYFYAVCCVTIFDLNQNSRQNVAVLMSINNVRFFFFLNRFLSIN